MLGKFRGNHPLFYELAVKLMRANDVMLGKFFILSMVYCGLELTSWRSDSALFACKMSVLPVEEVFLDQTKP